METLAKLKHETDSRGKRQRLDKKIKQLQGTPKSLPTLREPKQQIANEKVQQMLKKREAKLQQKPGAAAKMRDEDKTIVKQAKNKNREKRRERVADEDHFDELFKQYETKLKKRLAEPMPEGPKFEEVELSD